MVLFTLHVDQGVCSKYRRRIPYIYDYSCALMKNEQIIYFFTGSNNFDLVCL